MTAVLHPSSRMQRIIHAMRTRGVRVVMRQYLRRKGIHVTTFYYVMERPPAEIAPALTALPPEFSFGVFDDADMALVAKFPDQGATFTESSVRGSIERGDTCLGVKRDGRIVAFTWFALDATHSNLHPAVMRPNEAYLYNMYVIPEVRGLQIAPILRYKNYQFLQAMGRDTYYSITVTSNRSSLRFKEKLNARKISLGLAVNLFGKFKKRWTLRRY